MTDPPATITYASVVGHESVCIGLTIVTLNDLKVLTADILGVYLTAPCDEKIWLTCGPKFDPELQGRKALVVKALHGLKSAGVCFFPKPHGILFEEFGLHKLYS